MADADLDEALRLVDDFCTKEQVADVLRKYREKGVKISAPTKELLIETNLREAVTSKSVPMTDVFNLIRDGEENGSQHIWLYKPKPGLKALFEFEAVAERLFGPNWPKQTAHLPTLALKPEDFVVSDLRRSPTKPADWFLKIYGHATVTVATGERKAGENGTFWREYKDVPLRTVILVRWNSPDIFEVRIQKHESRRKMEAWLEAAWTMIRPAFLRDQFRPMKLETLLKNLVDNCDKHADLFEFRDAKVLEADGEHQATYECVSDQGSLLSSQRTANELKRRLKDGDTLKGLAVTWKSEKTALNEDLRMLVATRQENELLIPAKCGPKDLDHVTDQIRRFS